MVCSAHFVMGQARVSPIAVPPMLKALELVGFKSFADKTRFAFPRGVTVVVGPNGSGKSNIVDAIKWVLGEQSVKSLRGKEMADVIFNGSSSRRAQNSAECTMIFDNSNGLVELDAPEVSVTRRVYRSGEGEYLINGQASRLKDIRELFAGTGVTTQAYSVIEQGKVDVLLQSSPRDRRMIFEEAAGISRFKAKKLEATRRLERVEQNLLRLSDIVDEVESRLKTIRNQASKARRYREYSERLQQIRTQVAMVDWRKLSDRLTGLEEQVADWREKAEAETAHADAIEQESSQSDVRMSELEACVRTNQAERAQNRERIVAIESRIEHQRQRAEEIAEDVQRHRSRVATISSSAGDLREQLDVTTRQVDEAETEQQAAGARVADLEKQLSEATQGAEQLRTEQTSARERHVELMHEAAACGKEISELEARLETAQAACTRLEPQLAKAEGRLSKAKSDYEELERRQAELVEDAERRGETVEAAAQQLKQQRSSLTKRQKEYAKLAERHAAARERAAVLDDLERRLEGLGKAVKDILLQSRSSEPGPYAGVRGLVADLLQVSVESATLIEVALGDAAQHLVVTESKSLWGHLGGQSARLAGSVGFICLDAAARQQSGRAADLAETPGVVGRADGFVRCDSTVPVLAERLLANTWIVENLDRAIELAARATPESRFVTLAGELVKPGGVIVTGPRRANTGLISRRSELRALKTELEDLTKKMAEHQVAVEQIEQTVIQVDQQVERLTKEHHDVTQAVQKHQLQLENIADRRDQYHAEVEQLGVRIAEYQRSRDTAESSLKTSRGRLTELDQAVEQLENDLKNQVEELDKVTQQQHLVGEQLTGAKVDLAKSEQRLDSLRVRLQQCQHDQEQRQRHIDETRAALETAVRQSASTDMSILNDEAGVAELYLVKEQLAESSVDLEADRDRLHEQRRGYAAQVKSARDAARRFEDKLHKSELAAGQVRHERTTLADRLREDYEIDLEAVDHEPTEEEQEERQQVEEEIEQLRRKINNMGGVNLEALGELEDLESRYESLHTQYEDLVTAKNSLQQIIGRINADSRRLFSETLQIVRGHFQELFRKLFGGGQADIITDDHEDVLESGIEIIARPPGKEPRSISLLSGGEKTLTCVGLLLAIFRSRPSPFCVLDEVDAALDEANIGRFIDVLNDFTELSQFIVVTHSKKTMTAANTLYGVTMQESGISKRVSVRFEDVTDDGHIIEREGMDDEDAAGGEDDSSPPDDETQAA